MDGVKKKEKEKPDQTQELPQGQTSHCLVEGLDNPDGKKVTWEIVATATVTSKKAAGKQMHGQIR